MQWNEQCSEWYTEKELLDEVRTSGDWQKEKDKDTTKQSETLRDKRERIILEWYKRKLNRDEVLKIIMWCDGIKLEVKKQLESKILSDFYDQFTMATSNESYQEMDHEYRIYKKTDREYKKKREEVRKKQEESKMEVIENDWKLYEIWMSAMQLEDWSRWKESKLRKAKNKWDELEKRQKEILEGIRKLIVERDQLESRLSIQDEKYWKKMKGKRIVQRSRPRIEPDKLDWQTWREENSENTLKWYKEKYMKILEDKEKHLENLLQQIEKLDMWVSEDTKSEVVRQLRWGLRKEIEVMKEWDEFIKMANEIEEYLEHNLEATKEKLIQLNEDIQKKKEEIQELQAKEERANMDELMKIWEEELKKKEEDFRLQEEYQRIESELNEKITQYEWEKETLKD